MEAADRTAPALSEEARAQVTLPAEALRAGRDLTFRVRVNPDGLEPYLGAWRHFVLIAEGHLDFQHVHPEGGRGRAAADHHANWREPAPSELRFSANFPRAGRYKLWAQFQRGGTVEVATYRFDVQASAAPAPLPAVPPGAVRVDVSREGFSPALVTAPAGHAVKLAFVRAADAGGCASRVVVPAAGIDKPLAPGGVTVIELLAPALA